MSCSWPGAARHRRRLREMNEVYSGEASPSVSLELAWMGAAAAASKGEGFMACLLALDRLVGCRPASRTPSFP